MISQRMIKNHIYYKIEQILKKYNIEDYKLNKIRDEIYNELKEIII